MTLDNSKIRRIVLVEHEGLRIGLRSIEALLDRVAKGDVAALKDAQQQFTQFLEAFVRHIEHEERILRPVLQTVDAWGPARVASMDEEHTVQRKQVTRLAQMDAVNDPAKWATEVRAFATELLADMADEEKTCLSPDVLRDDIIAVGPDSE